MPQSMKRGDMLLRTMSNRATPNPSRCRTLDIDQAPLSPYLFIESFSVMRRAL
jgi:hypothetical protein